ncbi:MAG: NAD+ synthase [Nitrospinota bacterium]
MIRIAIAQINPTVGDLAGNARKINDAVNAAVKKSAAVVLFPELALTGYPPEDLLFKKSFLKAAKRTLKEIASKTPECIHALVGCPHEEGGQLYNGAALLAGGGIRGFFHKSHLPNYGVFDEKRYFTAETEPRPVELSSVRTAVTICEDIWLPEGPPARLSAQPDVELIVNISSSPFHIGKMAERREIVSSWARRFGKPLAYCNLVGGQDELVFDGGSFICDGSGGIIASARQFTEELLIADVPIGGPAESGSAMEPGVAPLLDYPEKLFEALKLGTRDYVEKNGFKKTAIAVSGGIDSALTVAVAVAALGNERVKGLAMPSRYSSESSLSDARLLAENHSIHLDVIPITGLMDKFDESLKELFKGAGPGIAEENIQARIRGTLMMALSNRFGHLVLTTGNKSELGVGYCTLYGDMAGGFAVIKDVPKKGVYELCEWINGRKELPDIPKSIIDKEPSAELRPDQRDSDSLPEYAALDSILKEYVEEEKSIEEIIDLGYSERDVKKVIQLVNRNEYKRRQAPPGIRITPKAFGKDRRMPITNRFVEWESE